ncbi:MAG: hypothetical protein ABDH49_00065 [Candidatus Hydrothermales bacterium]
MFNFLFQFFLILQLFPSLPFPQEEKEFKSAVWIPYDFKGTEYFKYEVIGKEEKETKKGFEIIKISKEDDKYKVYIEGKFGKSEGSSTVTVESKGDIPGVILSQAAFNPYIAPLAVALFTPAWTYYFTIAGFKFEEGSKWKQKDESGKVIEMEVVKGTQTYAGKKGKKLIIKEDGKEIWVIVWSKDVALPLYIRMGQEKENFYELKLVEYKE